MPDTTEAPETQSEDEEEETTEEDSPEVTDDEEPEGTEDEDSEEDPLEAWKQEFEKNRLEELKGSLKEQLRAEMEEQATLAKRTEESAQVRERFNNSFKEATKQTNDLLKSLEVYDEDGKRLQFTDDFVQQIINPWNEHNKTILTGAESQVYSSIAETVYNSLPVEARDEFAKRAANKPLKDYLTAFAELYAPSTAAIKKMNAEMEEKIKAAEARGYAKGRKAGGSTIPPNGERSAIPPKSKAPDTSTLSGATKALHAGQLTQKEFDEIVRAKFNR